jgi:hypothetical protein
MVHAPIAPISALYRQTVKRRIGQLVSRSLIREVSLWNDELAADLDFTLI